MSLESWPFTSNDEAHMGGPTAIHTLEIHNKTIIGVSDDIKNQNFPIQSFGDGSPLLWRGCSRMPCGFVRPHVVSCDSTVYVGGGSTGKVETSRTVYKYRTIDNAWSSLPIAPYYTFALAVVKGCVTGER